MLDLCDHYLPISCKTEKTLLKYFPLQGSPIALAQASGHIHPTNIFPKSSFIALRDIGRYH